jgi:hypothetical protein
LFQLPSNQYVRRQRRHADFGAALTACSWPYSCSMVWTLRSATAYTPLRSRMRTGK